MISVETSPDTYEIIATFRVAAAPDIVWRVWNGPEFVRQWWPCENMTMSTCENDVRSGGTYRYVGELDGQAHAFSGEYLDVLEGQQLVHTEVYEPHPAAAATITVTLSKQDGQTVVTDRTLFQSQEAFEGALANGMAEGIEGSLSRLARLAESMGSAGFTEEAG